MKISDDEIISEENKASLLLCENLVKIFSGKKVLKGINIELPKGKIVGLLGPNGSGKTTFIKLACGLLTPASGEILIKGKKPGIESKKIISYLPEKTYLSNWMRISEMVSYFRDFYEDFDSNKAYDMLKDLKIDSNERFKTLSKGTKEKVQLILVMSRKAELYFLDEPIAGVDPAARDYILNTILKNYNQDATLVISTHLIADIENILDEVIFLSYGEIKLMGNAEEIRKREGKTIDSLFREVFKC